MAFSVPCRGGEQPASKAVAALRRVDIQILNIDAGAAAPTGKGAKKQGHANRAAGPLSQKHLKAGKSSKAFPQEILFGRPHEVVFAECPGQSGQEFADGRDVIAFGGADERAGTGCRRTGSHVAPFFGYCAENLSASRSAGSARQTRPFQPVIVSAAQSAFQMLSSVASMTA